MKKLLLLTKTLLAAALLCVGQNAWAQTTTTLYGRAVSADLENGYSAWTEDDVTTSSSSTAWKASAASVEINATTGLTIPKAAASENATYSGLTPDEGVILTYDAVFGFQTGNRDSNNGYIQFGSGIVIKACGQQQKVWLEVNGNIVQLGTTSTSGNRWDDELTIHLEVNTFTKKITSLTVTAANNSATINYTNDADIDVASDATYTSMKIGENRGQSTLQAGAYLKSIRVKQTTQAVSSVNYTVKFQDTSGNTLKDDAVYTNGIVGEVYSAPSSDLNTFYSDDTNKKYVYKSGQNTETIASETASENVITLVFDTYTKYHYSLTTSAGSLVDTQEGDEYSDATKTLYYPVCIKDGSDYYVVDKNGSAPYFGYTLSAAENTKTINYTLDTDVVYYAEAEDIASQMYASNWLGNYSSKGNSKILQANKAGTSFIKTAMNTTSDGVYKITIASGDRSNRSYSRTWWLIDGEDNTTKLKDYDITNNQFMTDEITALIPSGNEIYYLLDNTGGSSALNDNYAVDYIIVRKSSVSATITSAGWATLYTPYALDFSSVDGLTAYTATCSDNTVTLTPVDNVPANTGVILKGAANTYSIPVVASSSTDQGHLKGSATEATAYDAFDGYTLYVLTTIDEGANVQFNPVNAGSIAAGKAYLKISGGASYARALRVVFDDITGVANVEAAAEAKAKDCKFIENGKLVIVKNGQKYNAAGQQVK